jgi:hypothetical protein
VVNGAAAGVFQHQFLDPRNVVFFNENDPVLGPQKIVKCPFSGQFPKVILGRRNQFAIQNNIGFPKFPNFFM